MAQGSLNHLEGAISINVQFTTAYTLAVQAEAKVDRLFWGRVDHDCRLRKLGTQHMFRYHNYSKRTNIYKHIQEP